MKPHTARRIAVQSGAGASRPNPRRAVSGERASELALTAARCAKSQSRGHAPMTQMSCLASSLQFPAMSGGQAACVLIGGTGGHRHRLSRRPPVRIARVEVVAG